MRGRISTEEKGPEKWQAFVTWLNTPPGLGVPSRPEQLPPEPSRAEQIRAAAQAAVGNQGAAFAAFAGTV